MTQSKSFKFDTTLAFSAFGCENKEKYPIDVSKQCCQEKHVKLLLIREGEKALSSYQRFQQMHVWWFITSWHCLNCRYCLHCLHAFITEEKVKHHIKDCFRINGEQTIKMPKKDKYVKFKNFERKIKSSFMIYGDVESILLPEDNGKRNPNQSYTNKYEKHDAYRYGYKLVYVDD